MIMNLNILAATVRPFKMITDYTLDLTPPFSPCPQSLPQKEREDEEIALKFPLALVLAHVVIAANTPSKFFRLHLGTNFLSFDWDLLAFQINFCSPPLPPPPPTMLLLKSSHRPKLSASHASPRIKRASF